MGKNEEMIGQNTVRNPKINNSLLNWRDFMQIMAMIIFICAEIMMTIQ